MAKQLERRQRTEDGIDLVALDQFLGLGLGAGRIAAGIGGDEVDLAAAHRVIRLLQIGQHALFHLDAALGERPGLHRQKAELERRGLRDSGRRKAGERSRRAGGGTGQQARGGLLCGT